MELIEPLTDCPEKFSIEKTIEALKDNSKLNNSNEN